MSLGVVRLVAFLLTLLSAVPFASARLQRHFDPADGGEWPAFVGLMLLVLAMGPYVLVIALLRPSRPHQVRAGLDLAVAAGVIGSVLQLANPALALVLLPPNILLAASGLARAADYPASGGPYRRLAGALILLLFGLATLLAGVLAVPSKYGRDRQELNARLSCERVLEAEASFRRASGGDFATLECLTDPARCLPAYEGGPFLPPDHATARDYRFSFHAGPPGQGEGRVRTFAFTAAPTPPDGRLRAFCGDHTGVVRYRPGGSLPTITGSGCPGSLPAAHD